MPSPGLALFADLDASRSSRPWRTRSNEESFPAGQRIQRQGFAGSGFHVILDGEAVVRVDGDERAQARARATSSARARCSSESPAIADVVADTPVRTLQLAGPDLHAFLLTYPAVMYRMLQLVSRRLRSRESPGLGRVVPGRQGDARRRERGSGATLPARRLRRHRRGQRAGRAPDQLLPDAPRHRPRGHQRRPGRPAACSAASRSSSACSRGPSRTRSWPTTTREYERYDWNSLIALEPEHRAVMPPLMDGSSEFPSRPEMEQGLRLFAERTGLRVRYDTRWQGTSHDGERLRPPHLRRRLPREGPRLRRRSRRAARCPRRPASSSPRTTRDTRPAETYAGKRLFIIGKQNSGFELASGLLQWASPIVLASPRAAQLSVNLHSLDGVRARYIQPWEDAKLGGGVFILNASIERLERQPSGITVHTRRSDNGAPLPGRGRRGHRGDGLPQPAARPRGARRQRRSVAADGPR